MSTLLILLALSLLLVPLSKKLGTGMVVGFLVVGLLAGPNGLGWISNTSFISEISELGVVFLLFLIGLELEPKKLWKLRKTLFGLGSAQMILCTLGIGALALTCGFSWQVSLVTAMGFALSSTAIGLQILDEKELRQTPSGQAGFSALLFQDIAVIPMLALLALLKSQDPVQLSGAHAADIPVWKSLLALFSLTAGGLLISRPLFKLVARSELREIFLIASLFVVLGSASLMHAAGLSMALGTFVSGVILANSAYRFELEAAIEPFKGLLMGLFFASVGMGLDLTLFAEKPLFWVGIALGVMIIKIGIHLIVARLFGVGVKSKFDAWAFAIPIAQVGEFAFVLFLLAVGYGILTPELAQQLNLVTILTMILSSPLFTIFEKTYQKIESKNSIKRPFDALPENSDHVIVAGYGRVGGVIGRLLIAKKIRITALDLDPNQVELVSRFGFKGFYGDAARLDLLRSAGAEKAKVLVIAIDQMDDTLHLVELAQNHFPNLRLIVRCRNRQDYYLLRKKGLTHIVRETFGAAIHMSQLTLEALGYGRHEAYEAAERFKLHDEEMLEESWKDAEDEKRLIARSQLAREQLSQLMESDRSSKDAW